ncbi:enoyl-CoA hydratase [Nitratireductor indicus C115]|uniref:Enoyl-CoA hydratase n=1 Tax=Nitratireductor indicus C115 TaxID=1231190 RepID=K2N5G3_9HYPH|nr:enoyl-CoA hydratase/isomerase family protein [Nitratireductor indicus]EKF42638.1 enoyl-CoA hydratase [Nitratireductor indicus C115]SFQ38066.1 Enoyl-CoA hydratase/carnithine racemase [Nitratireductor indicus]
MDHLVHTFEENVLTLTLNRPEKLNALTPDIYKALGDLIEEASGKDDCKAIVLKGAGRAFSSGFDLKLEVSHRSHAQKLHTLQNVANRLRWAIWRSPKPVVAAIHGYCLGGAFELMLPCDFTIASEECQLGEPEILFGAGPAFMMVPWMTGHKRAKDVLLSGRRISAREALDMGLVTSVVASGTHEEEAERLVRTLCAIPAPAIAMNKRGINRAYETMGMGPHLESWAESTAYLGYVIEEEGSEFQKILEREGTSAALRWRENRFGSGKDKA